MYSGVPSPQANACFAYCRVGDAIRKLLRLSRPMMDPSGAVAAVTAGKIPGFGGWPFVPLPRILRVHVYWKG